MLGHLFPSTAATSRCLRCDCAYASPAATFACVPRADLVTRYPDTIRRVERAVTPGPVRA